MHELSPPFSAERLQTVLRTAWLGRAFVYEPVVGSTMDVARSLVASGAANGTIIAADEQTAGRGRLGRRWLAPPGVNLAFSMLLFPSLVQLRRLSILAPLAVLEGVREACGLSCSIKWPNDVQVHGRKLAGVLLESELRGETPRFAIIGIGLNVNFDVASEPEIAGLATSLLRETDRTWERELVLAACLNAFERLYDGPAESAFERWRVSLNTLGQRIRVSFQGRVEEGVAADVDADGSLILRRTDGARVVLPAGEVSLRA